MTAANRTRSGLAAFWRIYAAGAVACAAVSGGAYLFGLRPVLAHRDAYAAEADELQARREKARAVSAALATARFQLDGTTRDVAALPLKLEPGSAVNARLARLAEVAAEAGLVLDEVRPGPPVAGPHYEALPIRVGGTGTYPACAAFLHRLRDQFPDVGVKAFDCANPSGALDTKSPTGPVASFRADLAWYTLPAKK